MVTPAGTKKQQRPTNQTTNRLTEQSMRDQIERFGPALLARGARKRLFVYIQRRLTPPPVSKTARLAVVAKNWLQSI